MTGTDTLTALDLIHAHQGALDYLAANYPGKLTLTTRDMADGAHLWLTPDNTTGQAALRAIARRMGKPVTSVNVHQVIGYFLAA